MSQFFRLHPDNPQQRLIRQAADIVRGGGVIVYPTDAAYALGCMPGNKEAQDRIRRIRQLADHHYLTLVVRDLSQLGLYARLGNQAYAIVRSATPGPFTFILQATREVPRRLQHPKRKTVGLRMPENRICQALLETLGEPMLSATLILPNDEYPLHDPHEIRSRLESQVELVLDGGSGGLEVTTVVDLSGDEPQLLRQGLGQLKGLKA